jgi:solute carrier family 25 uncoupling protein 8/9
MQIQKPLADGTYKYSGLLKGTGIIFREEGLPALYKGLGAGFQRQIIFASLRIGLYEPVRNILN